MIKNKNFQSVSQSVSQSSEDDLFPLLLTGTIKPSHHEVSPERVHARLLEYERTILLYIQKTKANPIVFVENSGYLFPVEKFEDIAVEKGKIFEFVSGTNTDEETIKRGMGYGDGKLICEGLTKSKALRNVNFFYKVTGRLFIANFNQIIRTAHCHRNEFISYDGIGWCLTWFFKANRMDYLKTLGDVYRDCDDQSRRDLEICVWMRLKESGLDISSFHTYPYTIGKMGDTNQRYIAGIGEYFLRDVMIKTGLFTMNSPTSGLFWKTFRKITGRKPYVSENDIIKKI